MGIAMAGLARVISQHGMNTIRHMGYFVRVAGRALDLHNFGGVGIFLDCGVTVATAQNAVDAGGVFSRINQNTLAAGRLHPSLAVARQAVLILLGQS
jgi:hypothetical protein